MTMVFSPVGMRPEVRIGRALETIFACLASFIYGTQAVQMLFGSTDQASAGRPVAVYSTFLVLYTITLIILFLDGRFVRSLLLHLTLILLLLMFPFVSVIWSVRPNETFQRAIAGFGSSCFGLFLFWRYSLQIALRILAFAMTCAAAGSLFVAVFMPHIGLMVDETWAGAWRGLYYHKNSLGAAIALATIMLTYVFLTDTPLCRLLALLGLGLCALVLLASRSMTALLTTMTCLGLIAWARAIQRSPNMTVTMTLIGAITVCSVIFLLLSFASLEDAFILLGKKAGMSGRFPLWEQVSFFISRRPWLGYGYEAFWKEDATETRLIAAVIKYTPFYSHNGALEVMLTGGIMLLSLIVVLIFTIAVRAWEFARHHDQALPATFPLVFVGYLILSNISESHLLMRNDLIWSITLGLSMRLSLERLLRCQEAGHAMG